MVNPKQLNETKKKARVQQMLLRLFLNKTYDKSNEGLSKFMDAQY